MEAFFLYLTLPPSTHAQRAVPREFLKLNPSKKILPAVNFCPHTKQRGPNPYVQAMWEGQGACSFSAPPPLAWGGRWGTAPPPGLGMGGGRAGYLLLCPHYVKPPRPLLACLPPQLTRRRHFDYLPLFFPPHWRLTPAPPSPLGRLPHACAQLQPPTITSSSYWPNLSWYRSTASSAHLTIGWAASFFYPLLIGRLYFPVCFFASGRLLFLRATGTGCWEKSGWRVWWERERGGTESWGGGAEGREGKAGHGSGDGRGR